MNKNYLNRSENIHENRNPIAIAVHHAPFAMDYIICIVDIYYIRVR